MSHHHKHHNHRGDIPWQDYDPAGLLLLGFLAMVGVGLFLLIIIPLGWFNWVLHAGT